MKCMNDLCGATETGDGGEWKKGWNLSSGGLATLCVKCGAAYEQLIFCDIFHQKESGWRECISCGKHLHRGCIASRSSFDLLDGGRVQCIGCIRSFESSSNRQKMLSLPTRSLIDMKVNYIGSNVEVTASESAAFSAERKVNVDKSTSCYVVDQTDTENRSIRHQAIGCSLASQGDDHKDVVQDKASCNSVTQACLSTEMETTNQDNKITGSLNSERPTSTLPLTLPMQWTGYFLPKPPQTGIGSPSDVSKDLFEQVRVARPPAEGRGHNKILRCHWPRITDQDLKQISGDSNCTIIPLFEKVLSASDAGRRLVLPKACAEVYFPPISQPEGLPLTIQDAKGKDWYFQFRFWPNNRSRMYVLEGIAPCMRSLKLQAGDTVTFSRINPEGKLLMGYRKAANTGSSQMNNHIGSPNLGIEMQPLNKREQKIGAKSRRLLMDNEDALELALTWDEAQYLLRPHPSSTPRIFRVGDLELETYSKPPVVGKETIFAAKASGEHDQWVKCDECLKWRRLPIDVPVYSKWTCSANTWDPKRSSCTAPNELSDEEMQIILRQYEDFKRQRITNLKQAPSELDVSGLDASAAVASLADGDKATPSDATTTRHPKHRSGCKCIVCIQSPSGTFPRHNPSCTCHVCMAIQRRLKTITMRRKRDFKFEEAEANKRAAWTSKEAAEGTSSLSKDAPTFDHLQDSDFGSVFTETMAKKHDGKCLIDLNYPPVCEEETYMGENELESLAWVNREGDNVAEENWSRRE